MDFSEILVGLFWCCPLEGWVGNVVFVVFWSENLQKLQIHPKTTKSADFGQNPQIFSWNQLILWFLWIFRKKLMFSPWILSLDWELINNFLLLNSKTTQNPWISAKSLQILWFFADFELKSTQKPWILQFLQILTLNLPKICWSLAEICGFCRFCNHEV